MSEGRHVTRAEYKVISDKPDLIASKINALNGSGGAAFWRPILMTTMEGGNVVVLLERAIELFEDYGSEHTTS
jgi:hypothetical protein